jgi:pimeloyl-ACP methyl ester carboxylesterase
LKTEYGASVSKCVLSDGAESFDVTLFEAPESSHVVLFAVGAGGNPERHFPLLRALFDHGCTVVAPHFERLVTPTPTENDLLLRARRLSIALNIVERPGCVVSGVGHSIGATMLLALCGGQVWMGMGRRLPVAADTRFDKLALLTPATGFFQAPGALDAVHTPILAWAGTNDVITPPAQTEFLKQALKDRAPVEVRVVEGAGHFSFMNAPPPQTVDLLPNRDAFLSRLADEVCRFITS